MPTEFTTVTVSLPALILKLGQLRAKSQDRSFSSHVASLLRADASESIEHIKDDLRAHLQNLRDPVERETVQSQLDSLDTLDMTPERIARLAMSSSLSLNAPAKEELTPRPERAVNYRKGTTRAKGSAHKPKNFPKG